MKHKDLVTMEWGNSATNTAGTNADSDPNPEAGAIYQAGAFVYGIHLGSDARAYNKDRAGVVNAVSNVDNAIDLFMGGSAQFDWGINLTRSSTQDQSATGSENKKQSLTSIKIGVSQMQWEAFVHTALENKAENANSKFKGKTDFTVGGTYNFKNYKLFGLLRSFEYQDGASAKTERTHLRLGAAREKKVSDKISLFTRAEFNYLKAKDNQGSTKTNAIPLAMGIESSIKSWLVVRSSIVTSLYNQTKSGGNKKDQPNQMGLSAGASLIFDNLTFDGVITTANNLNLALQNGAEQGSMANENVIGHVSMTYRF